MATKMYFTSKVQKSMSQFLCCVGRKAGVIGNVLRSTDSKLPGMCENPTQKTVPICVTIVRVQSCLR